MNDITNPPSNGSDNNSINPPSPNSGTVQNFNNSGAGPQVAQNSGIIINGNVILDCSDPNVMKTLNDLFPGIAAAPPASNEWDSLSNTRFNIFVLENESYKNNAFCMPNRFCLPDDMTDPKLKKQYHDLDDATKAELCSFPCIFAHRNNEGYKTANATLPAVIGRLTEIYPQTENIKFVFKAYKTDVGQQLFNTYISELGLANVAIRNEFDVEHWSVKSGDLKGFVANHGITIV